MPSEIVGMVRASRAAMVALVLCATLPVGCDSGSSGDSANAAANGAGATTENETETTDAAGLPKPAARSALGKAKERAEKLINEDVAEYNKKIEQAAEGKYP